MATPKAPRVLLVEDEPTIAVTLVDDLEAAGFAVTHTPDGREGATLAAHGGFAAVITDLRLPGADGADVLAAALRSRRRPCLCVLTAWLAGRRGELQQLGAQAIFEKPFANEHVVAWLRREVSAARVG